MPAAVLLSGAANLAGEALWHRMASILVGDMSLSTTIVWSTFFLGSAIGALAARRYVKFLWLFEAGPALWSLLWAALIQSGALAWSLSPAHLAIIMLLPAIAMGAHIPAYSVLAKGGIAKSWSKWHLGGALGIFALAALPAGALSTQLAALGALQLAFAFGLFAALRKASIATPAKTARLPWHAAIAPVLVGCFAASWMAAGLLQLSFLTFPVRIVGAAALAASAIASALGGARLLAKLQPWSGLFPSGAAAIAVISLPASGLLVSLLFPQADPLLFGLAALALAILLMAPLALTGAWYVAKAEKSDLGAILALAALGNACGFVGFHLGGMQFTAAAAIAATTIAITDLIRRMTGIRAIATGVLSIVMAVVLGGAIMKPFDWFYRTSGVLAWQESWSERHAVTVRRDADSWWALVEGTDREHGTQFHDLTIHGAPSHDLASGVEFASPLVGGSYLEHRHARRTLILGILSGQTSASAASFSDQVDAVDVSPAALDAVTQLSTWNGDVGSNPKVNFIIDDGLTVLKACAPGSYDLIVNGASSPATTAGAKMFSAEAVTLAKRCLAPGGVYMSYLSSASFPSLRAANLLVRPLKQAFQQVDLTVEPYPLLIAYDHSVGEDHLAGLSGMLQSDPDFTMLAVKTAPGMFIFDRGTPKMRQIRILRDYRPMPGELPTLDNGRAEQAAVPTYLKFWAGEGHSTLRDDIIKLLELLQKIG